MPMWRCPHCGTPQAETARCWVCRRSSTACATCRHYRRAVAGQLGYCGLDPRRQPLTGEEIRGCWEAWPIGIATTTAPLTMSPARALEAGRQPIAFVEVAATPEPIDEGVEPAPPIGPAATPTSEPGWNLWGDPDR